MSSQAYNALQAFQSSALWLTVATLQAMYVLTGQLPVSSACLMASCVQITWLRFLHHLDRRTDRQPLFRVWWFALFLCLSRVEFFPCPPDPTLAQHVAWIWLRCLQSAVIPAMSFPLSLRTE